MQNIGQSKIIKTYPAKDGVVEIEIEPCGVDIYGIAIDGLYLSITDRIEVVSNHDDYINSFYKNGYFNPRSENRNYLKYPDSTSKSIKVRCTEPWLAKEWVSGEIVDIFTYEVYDKDYRIKNIEEIITRADLKISELTEKASIYKKELKFLKQII